MRRLAVLLALAVAGIPAAHAQTPPSDARMRADAIEHIAPSATSVTIRGDGHRELNGGVYEYVRSITVRYPYPGMPGVEVEGRHDIVYQSHGSTYAYARARTGDWTFFGLPKPTLEEVQVVVDADNVSPWGSEVMMLDRRIVVEETDAPTKARYTSARGTAHYKLGIDGNWMVDVEATATITVYRDSVEGEWRSVHVEMSDLVEGERSTIPAGVLRKREMEEVQQAAAVGAALPEVTVPVFASRAALIAFAYRTLRETQDPDQLEAYMRALAPDSYFADQERLSLTEYQSRFMRNRVDDMFSFGSSFEEITCETPVYYGDDEGRVYFQSLVDLRDSTPANPTASLRMTIGQEEGGYRNGERVPGGWVVYGIEAGFGADADDLAWLRSLDDPQSLCTATGQATQAAAQEAQDAAGRATEEAQGAVEGAVQEGRRRLGRLLGRGN